jgi:hypothetical protein
MNSWFTVKAKVLIPQNVGPNDTYIVLESLLLNFMFA